MQSFTLPFFFVSGSMDHDFTGIIEFMQTEKEARDVYEREIENNQIFDTMMVHRVNEFGPFRDTEESENQMNYSVLTTPKKYHCEKCKVGGVKLWRDDDLNLICADCMVPGQGAFFDSSGKTKHDLGMTDQYRHPTLGMLLPAVPCEDAVATFWGYTSVPDEAVKWWKALPTYSVEQFRARHVAVLP